MPTGPKTSLDLYRRTATDDGMGGSEYTWTKIKSIVGVFSTLSDRERISYGKLAEGATHKFAVDYMFVDESTANATTKDIFMSGSREFEIISRENPMNQNRFIIFLLTEEVDG
jgi:hypothetical protein